MIDGPTLDQHLADLRLNLTRLREIVEEVSKAIGEGDLDRSMLLLGSQTGKIGQFTESYAALQSKLIEEGASWKRARDRALGYEEGEAG